MAMARYNPTARPSSRTMPSGGSPRPSATDPTRGYANADGPGGSTVDYGPHRGGFSFNGLQSPRWSDRDPSFDYTPEKLAAEAAARQPYLDARNAALNADPAYSQAAAGGDIKAALARMVQMKQANQRQNFIDQGGQGATWDNRFSNENNYPRPTSSIGYSHGPGRPDFDTRATNPSPYGPGNTAPGVRRGATPQANAPMSAGAPPSANPMFEGYQGGGQGIVSGGSGQFGRAGGMPPGSGDPYYRPGKPQPTPQDLAQEQYMRDNGLGKYAPMLQGPSSLGMGGGNPFGAMGNAIGVNYGGGNPFAGAGGGETGMMYPGGGMPGPMMQNSEMGLFSRLFGGGMPMGGNMGMMGGGYNPYASFGMY